MIEQAECENYERDRNIARRHAFVHDEVLRSALSLYLANPNNIPEEHRDMAKLMLTRIRQQEI